MNSTLCLASHDCAATLAPIYREVRANAIEEIKVGDVVILTNVGQRLPSLPSGLEWGRLGLEEPNESYNEQGTYYYPVILIVKRIP